MNTEKTPLEVQTQPSCLGDVSGSVDLTGMNNTNSMVIIGKTTTDTTIMKAGWYSDNFSTYYLDEDGVKHYR